MLGRLLGGVRLGAAMVGLVGRRATRGCHACDCAACGLGVRVPGLRVRVLGLEGPGFGVLGVAAWRLR